MGAVLRALMFLVLVVSVIVVVAAFELALWMLAHDIRQRLWRR